MKLNAGVDCLPTYPVGAKKYICFEVTPGRHVFAVHAENLGQDVVAPVGKEVPIAEGEEVFISFGLSKGVKLLPARDGQKLRKRYKIMKSGYHTPGLDSSM